MTSIANPPPAINTVADRAEQYHAVGISIIPVRRDGSKRPAIAWTAHQSRLSTDAERAAWFGGASPYGIAAICGTVSGGLEVIDYDHDADATYAEFARMVEAAAPGLMTVLVTSRTPSGGYHLWYRCPETTIAGNRKLARTATGETLIETRGEGGYVVAPGSPSCCHPTGRPYEVWRGDPAIDMPEITIAERELLHRVARSLDRRSTATASKRMTATATGGDLMTRARTYMQRCDPAVQGSDGSGTLMRVLRLLRATFPDLSPDDYAQLAREYSDRCIPPWATAELSHAVANIDARPSGITNFRIEKVVEGERERTIKIGLSHQAIHEKLKATIGEWPRVAGGMLFARGDDGTPRFFENPAQTFAWIGANTAATNGDDNPILWADRGDGMVSRTQMYEFLRMTAEQYDGVEAAPHFPPMPRLYYMHDATPASDGKALEGFLRFFNPLTPIDHELIKALVVTQFWGGECGKRPAWLIAGPDQDDHGGRGVGKTTLISKSAQLCGGCLWISDPAGGKPEELERRFLSPQGRKIRTVLIDNLKALRFSWAYIEATLTADTISGRQMFVGEGRRPNNLNIVITANGATLSRDMAQRCNVLKLARPNYQSGDWDAAISAYLAANRLAIWADIGAFFRRPRGKIETPTRWGSWQADVLSRLETPSAIQAELSARSAAYDADAEEKSLVRNEIADTIRARHFGVDPSRVTVKIAAKALAQIVNRAMGDRMQTPTANRHAMQLQIRELSRQTGKRTGRWYLWVGDDADPDAPPMAILPDGEPHTHADFLDAENIE